MGAAVAVTITPEAAQRMRSAYAEAGGAGVLRVAARREDDGSVDFGLGFDERRPGDLEVACEGVAVVVAPPSRALVEGATIDFVEIAPGDFRFIFAPPGAPAPQEAP